ncbi:MAG: ABC transporter permease [Acidimicrobiales bacterium]
MAWPQPGEPLVPSAVSKAERSSTGSRSSAAFAVVLSSLRDLQWRARRFLLAAVATGLVLGVALMMSGIANSFPVEIADTVAALGGPTWLVRTGSPGPFTDPAPFSRNEVTAVKRLPGMTSATPILVSRALESTLTPSSASRTAPAKDVNVLGVVPGRLGSPVVAEGEPIRTSGQAVADVSLGVAIGTTIDLNGSHFKVVGLLHGVTYFAGQPVVFVSLTALDRIVGDPVASAILVKGPPQTAVPGFTALDTAAVKADLNRPVAQAEETIKLIEILLWIVAAAIIAAVIYLSALERRVDFAVLKALGAPSAQLFLGLVIEAVAMALGAAVIGYGAEAALAPTSALAVRLSVGDYVAVPLLAVVVGIVASVLPARRAATVDPALAFGMGR